MKSIPLFDLGGMKSAHVIRQVLEMAPAPTPHRPGGIDIAGMRARCRLLDKLDALAPGADIFLVEDADHSTLVQAVNGMQWTIANSNLLKIIDGILEAKEPPEIPDYVA